MENQEESQFNEEVTVKLSYSHEMWDQLVVIKDSIDQRQKQMQSLKNFFKQYKKTIDQFKDGMKKAVF